MDWAAWAVGLLAAVLTRYEFRVTGGQFATAMVMVVFAVGLHSTFAYAQFLYRGRYGFGTFEEVRAVSATVLASASALFVSDLAMQTRPVPASAPIVGGALALVLMLNVRYLRRLRRERTLRPDAWVAAPVLLFGAGMAAHALLRSMLHDPRSRYLPVGLIDDDPDKRDLRILGVEVLGNRYDIPAAVARTGAVTVIFAVSNADARLVREVREMALNAGVEFKVLPSVSELLDHQPGVADLSRLEQAITGRLDLVGIAAGPNDNAHRIFESLNNTGRPLTQADLLRNYLFMLLPGRGDEVYERYWLPMQRRLGNEELEELAWLHLVVSGDDRVRRDDIYRAYQKLLRPIAARRDETAVEEFVAELARRAHHLQLILDPDRVPDPQLRAGLHRLRAWDASTPRPVVMLLLDRREQGTATNAEITEALGYLESFLVRRMLTGRDSKNVNRILNSAPARLASGPVAEQLRAYLSQERHFWADNDILREAIRERNFYWSGRTHQRLFVLRRLEETYGHREPVDWKQTKISIEHVLPQTMTDQWRATLVDGEADDRTAEEIHATVVHTLGNLTLTAYNQQLGNHPFTVKRKLLADSGLAMNHVIATQQRWAEPQILQRAADLADRAINLWPGPLPTQRPPAANPKWRLLRQALAVMPAGLWTSYYDLAELTGSHQVPVGQYLANEQAPHPWRVLTIDGTVSPHFRWQQPDRTDDPLDLLRAEGVRIDQRGRADPGQRLTAAELADLVGLQRDDATAPDEDTGEASFWTQLQTAQPGSVAQTLTILIERWRAAGGDVGFGAAEETTCFMFVRPGRSADGRRPPWPWAIYPLSGRVEVVFQHLKVRPPFDDPQTREQFRQLCNQIPGVNLPPAKLDVRPSFPLDVFADTNAIPTARAALDWFITTAD